MTERPTLADVAAKVGVSRTTVSNAYNRPDQLSAQMRDRILAAAADLGYAGPDPMARSLRTGRTGSIGLIFSGQLSTAFSDPNSVEFLQGVAAACEERDESLLLVPAGAEAAHMATVTRAAVDGFVIYSMPAGDPHIAAVLSRPEPAVVVDSPFGVDGVDYVGIEDRPGFRSIASHVLGLGHRRIALVAARCGDTRRWGPMSWGDVAGEPSAVVSERLGGMSDVLTERGLDPLGVRIELSGENTYEAGGAAVARLLADDPSLTAIMCTSDVLALGVLGELTRRGVAVPADVTVTGFDDIAGAGPAGLTTVRQPTTLKGRRAAELLLDPEPRPGPRVDIMTTSLQVRSSSGAPRTAIA